MTLLCFPASSQCGGLLRGDGSADGQRERGHRSHPERKGENERPSSGERDAPE